MNHTANYVKNRLSLRPPQERSLEILSRLTENFTLGKSVNLPAELEKTKTHYPTCTDFERDFPSICFALATGVGKTRLMGAFIAYLYLEKGIRNYFVLAPNLTVYRKLIEDFSNPASPKYVFPGIGDLAQNPPNIITDDNYENARHGNLYTDLNINLFNISKINAETRSGSDPKIKRLTEYLGESYFNYLANLPDLVLLMDESHHYRTDRGMTVINKLKPILGLELTATPQIERGNNTIKFKNVVYEYSLSKAIKDGFVKTPAVATRKDFDPSQHSDEELDRIKLEDGIRIHEDTRVALDIYARDNKTFAVKPFILVVAKDTQHSSQLKDLISSKGFFEGRYANKVMEINSSQHGSEKDENIQKLLSLEHPANEIEIVIHVNMLKEGWDVTNLYTIIPLRTAASTTLREQTIGRGLRLPYGRITGDSKADKLTIVSHDRFQEIVDEANKPDSIIRLENIIEIDEELTAPKETVTTTSQIARSFQAEEQRIAQIQDKAEQQKARFTLDTKRDIVSTLHTLNTEVKSVHDLTRPEIKKLAVEKIKERFQGDLFVEDRIKEAESHYDEPIVRPFTQIEDHNLSKFSGEAIHDYTETITPTKAIPTKIFTGFKRSCHDMYKFDSKTEKDFAAILEKDTVVLKWLRPAKRQFQIYWKHNSRQYVPDFVVETADAIYMVETKKEGDIETGDVQEKATAAAEYCKHASDYTTKNNGKPWKYVIIPHNAMLANMSFHVLADAQAQHG